VYIKSEQACLYCTQNLGLKSKEKTPLAGPCTNLLQSDWFHR